MSNIVIGLTGGIAAGKSTVSKNFESFGITVVDADLIARQVVEPNSIALQKIANYFGNSLILEDGTLNRANLRELVFSDEQNKLWLNNLLHPLIRTEILAQLAAAKGPYVILDAPLLFENGLDKLCTKTVLVDIPEALQVERASARDDVSSVQIKSIIAAQMPRKEKLQKADLIIDNSKSKENTGQQVEKIHQSLLSNHFVG